MQSNLNGSYDMLEEHIKQLERQKVLFVASQGPDAYGFTPATCTGGRERSPLVGEKRGYGTMAAPCDSMYVPPYSVHEHVWPRSQAHVRLLVWHAAYQILESKLIGL
jgi:hypothetical protein